MEKKLWYGRKGRCLGHRVLSLIWMVMALVGNTQSASRCPEECTCRTTYRSEEGPALRVACLRGGMNYIPVGELDQEMHLLFIVGQPQNPNHITIGPILTQPKPFAALRELHIVNSNVPSIGQYSFWGLHNLAVLNLTFNNLTSIGTDDFRGLINLTKLYLDHNNIEDMPSETFYHLTALKVLSLTHNRISSLVPRLFRMLAALTFLDLGYNPLTDLNPEVFKDIQNLKVLKCRRCMLNMINTQIYHLAPLIEELDLGENLFKYFTPDEFISLKKLRQVKIDGNQMSVVVDNLFGNNRELRMLSVANNRVALLAPAALTNLTKLVHLDISHNKLERFQLQAFAPVVNSLRTINLSGNNLPLNEIALVLQILPDLHVVGLANLSLPEIPPNFFMYNEHLVALDISWNKFTTFPFKLLSKTKFLQRLDISHNKLQSLNEQDLQRLEAIAEVNLARNPWHCDQCSTGVMLVYMAITVLNSTLRQLRCHAPLRLSGVRLSDLNYELLDPCTSTHEAQMSVIAGLVLLLVAVLAAVTGALCCTRRRAAHYYTNEDKRREHDHEHPEELLTHTEHGSVATINSPYHLVPKCS